MVQQTTEQKIKKVNIWYHVNDTIITFIWFYKEMGLLNAYCISEIRQ